MDLDSPYFDSTCIMLKEAAAFVDERNAIDLSEVFESRALGTRRIIGHTVGYCKESGCPPHGHVVGEVILDGMRDSEGQRSDVDDIEIALDSEGLNEIIAVANRAPDTVANFDLVVEEAVGTSISKCVAGISI